mmetsp:Transcript_24223/g.39439  ORF Transcript_24223/g.39439 Transcript_24223/m.39439 type:complete len:89 (+) Transcript_24223:134-400(+)
MDAALPKAQSFLLPLSAAWQSEHCSIAAEDRSPVVFAYFKQLVHHRGRQLERRRRDNESEGEERGGLLNEDEDCDEVIASAHLISECM